MQSLYIPIKSQMPAGDSEPASSSALRGEPPLARIITFRRMRCLNHHLVRGSNAVLRNFEHVWIYQGVHCWLLVEVGSQPTEGSQPTS